MNLGCIELNPWSSKIDKIEFPDYLIIDLDPQQIEFDKTVKTALEIKKILDQIKVESFIKTSGASGLHIFVPTGRKYKYNKIKDFAMLICLAVYKKLPSITSLERSPKKRIGKIYLDYLQNRKGQTMACAYSLRPKKTAPISTPLLWTEVNTILNPEKYNIKTMPNRLKKMGDVWPNFWKSNFNMLDSLKKLNKLI